MDAASLLAMLEFSRARLLGSLDAIEKSGEKPQDVLMWRPARNRAHIAWQAMHCAATHDRYFNVLLQGRPAPSDPALVSTYGGGSIPSDDGAPSIAAIRETLARHYTPLKAFVNGLSPQDMEKVVGPPERQRKLGDAILLLAWHEAHHQGQLHLTWNLYRQANGIV